MHLQRCVCVRACVSLFDLVVLVVNVLLEVPVLLVQAQEPVLQLLPGHPRDVVGLVSRSSIVVD